VEAERLLIIDQNRHFSETARRFLSRRSELRAVETASNVDQALATLEVFKPTLVLVSDSMLRKSELLAATFCKLAEIFPSLKVIMLTLYSDPSNRVAQTEKGCISGVIGKDDFARNINNYLKEIRRDINES
jgi:DNA-binding NarL/FixJ family response regulator